MRVGERTREKKKDYGCGASVRAGKISPIVLGRADKLSAIMPASQSINYAEVEVEEAGCVRPLYGILRASPSF